MNFIVLSMHFHIFTYLYL